MTGQNLSKNVIVTGISKLSTIVLFREEDFSLFLVYCVLKTKYKIFNCV